MNKMSILDLMVKDHARLFRLLSTVESYFDRDKDRLMETLKVFEWNLEKHFFVEERAIFTSYNPERVEEGYELFIDLAKQHTKILEKMKAMKNQILEKGSADTAEFKELLTNHKNFEEKNIYLRLDKEIEEGEKRFIIERITDLL
jgi:hypothetical protein